MNKTTIGSVVVLVAVISISAINLSPNDRLPGEDAVYKISAFVDVSKDCKPRHVGAADPVLCDLTPAFKDIEEAIRTNVPRGWAGYGTRSGGQVVLPAGRFWLSAPVRFCRGMLVSGAGGGDWGAATVLYTPYASSGFRIAGYDECMKAGLGGGAQGTVLERFALIEATGVSDTTTPNFGIVMEARSELRDVWVNGFVQGVRASADHNRTPITNVNGWRLYNVNITNTRHAGLFVDGGDANVGMALMPNVTSGCQRATEWKATLGPCANFVISDFLGSTIVAAHSSNSHDSTSGENFPNFLFEGASQRGVCLGCYSESDSLPPVLAPQTMWLGNTAMSGIGGYRQAGSLASGIQYLNNRDPANIVSTRMGDMAAPSTGLELVPSGGAMTYPLRLKSENAKKCWRVDVANLNAGVALRIGGTVDAPGGWGGMSIPLPLRLNSAPLIGPAGTPMIVP